jgi:hypothetical protein
MIDRNIWEGVQSLLDNYVGLGTDDTVIVLYTSDSYESAAWVSAALELRKVSVKRVWMAPLHDDGFQDRLMAILPPSADFTGRLVVLTFERDTMSHGRILSNALVGYDRQQCVVFRAISSSADLFSSALRVLPEELSARNAAILNRCQPAHALRIKTRGGTDLRITIDTERYTWISNRGMARPRGAVILPAGEVATFPASISGVHVADFAFNVNAITDRDARLHDHPITVWIEEGRAVQFECGDPATSRFIEECLFTHCAYNVGELGFGTNSAVVKAIPMNSHINERCPGIHLGFGQHNQDPGIVGYQCSIHLDLISQGGTIWVDDDPIPLDLENIIPSAEPHPANPRDEDVFSPELEELSVDDCCGILTSDGLQLYTSASK